jgi:hypothetical protein
VLSAGIKLNHEPSFFESVQRILGARYALRKRGCEIVQTNVASVLARPPA